MTHPLRSTPDFESADSGSVDSGLADGANLDSTPSNATLHDWVSSPRESVTDLWPETPPVASGIRSLLKGLAMIASLAVIGGVVKTFGLTDALDIHWLDQQIVGRGFAGKSLFVLVGAGLTAIGIPRQVVAFGGGYAFGLLPGVILSLLAQTLGCAMTVLYARLFGRSLIRHRFGPRIQRIDRFLSGNTFSMTLLIRFLPVGSNLFTNLTVGVSSARVVPFLIGSAVGYVPQTIIFALLGTGVHLDTALRTALSVMLFIFSGLISVVLYRRVRQKSHNIH